MPCLNPLGLALAGLSLPLLAMYFIKVRRRRFEVPAAFLWQQALDAQRNASPFERFRRNLLLLLQLLALLLLSLALARPVLDLALPPARSLVLVLDTSASMGATDVPQGRLGAAVALASEVVDGLGSSDEAALGSPRSSSNSTIARVAHRRPLAARSLSGHASSAWRNPKRHSP